MGIRFHELGRQYPKCILPYNEKPIIVPNLHRILDIEQLETITIVVKHQAQKIIDTVTMYFPEEVKNEKINFRFYAKINGNSGPLVSINHGIIDRKNSLLVILSDILLESSLVLESSFVSCKKVDDYERWCMVEEKENLNFYDKVKERPPTTLALSGIYYFQNAGRLVDLMDDLFNNLKDKEPQISHILSLYQQFEKLQLKSVSIIDFGTLEEYEENRLERRSRIFNVVEEVGYKVIKRSREKRAKIIEEFNWYNSMPSKIQQYLPRIYDSNTKDELSDSTWYSLERIRFPTLREWYLFLESDVKFWDKVFDKLFGILDTFYETNNLGETFLEELFTKTVLRIEQLPPEYKDNDFLTRMKKIKSSKHDTLFHGDMCFSNIFFDDKTDEVKLIDPRGNIQGNVLYDYAKLMTSIIYDYDFIDAHLYTENNGDYKLFNSGKEKIKELFLVKLNKKFDKETIQLITILAANLFLTMIPLHSESPTNQKLFYECYKRALKDAT